MSTVTRWKGWCDAEKPDFNVTAHINLVDESVWLPVSLQLSHTIQNERRFVAWLGSLSDETLEVTDSRA